MNGLAIAALVISQVAAPAPEAKPSAATTHPMIEGEVATVDGYLVEEARFVEFLDAETNVRELGARLAIQVKYCQAAEESYKAQIRAIAERAANRPWYEDPALNRWVGFGIGTAVTILSIGVAMKVAQ